MSMFKPGDKVITVWEYDRAHRNPRIGQTYVVDSIDRRVGGRDYELKDVIKIRSYSNYYDERNFRLVGRMLPEELFRI